MVDVLTQGQAPWEWDGPPCPLVRTLRTAAARIAPRAGLPEAPCAARVLVATAVARIPKRSASVAARTRSTGPLPPELTLDAG